MLFRSIRQAHALLSEAEINFTGNIEGRDIPNGEVDVAVCDGFTGNVLLKFLEGVGTFFAAELKALYTYSIVSKLSVLAIKKGLNKFMKKFDYSEYGGTLILGVNGKVMKSHGSSNAKAIKNSIRSACNFARSNIIEHIKEQFINMEVEDIDQIGRAHV